MQQSSCIYSPHHSIAVLEKHFLTFIPHGHPRRDPDLEPLRENPKFEGLLKRFEPGGGFLSPLLRGFGGE